MKSYNPFQTPGIGGSIFCEEINNESLKFILDAYFGKNNRSVQSIAIVGETGTGKTTLINKVRQDIERQRDGFLVVVNGNQITRVENTAYYVLRVLVKELTRHNQLGVSFIQQVATNIVNESLKLSNQTIEFDSKQLIAKFDRLAREKGIVEKVRRVYQQHHPEFTVSSNLLRAILWTLSAKTSLNDGEDSFLYASAIEWLKGAPINEKDAKLMDIPFQMSLRNERQEDALEILGGLLHILTEYYSIVICFDELECIPPNGYGQPYWADFSIFFKDIFDFFNKIQTKNKIFLVDSWLPPDWNCIINGGVQDSIRARLSSLNNHHALKLTASLSIDEGLSLVECWLKQLNDNSASDPYAPFTQSKLESYLANGPTPRQLWNWCAKEWTEATAKKQSLQEVFSDYQNRIDEDIFTDDYYISQLLIMAFRLAKNAVIENVKVCHVKEMPQNAKFQLLLEGIENGQIVRIGIGICQGHAAKAGAMLNRLLDYERFGLSRGCFIRSNDFKLSPRILAFQKLEILVKQQDGEHVNLIDHELYELDALLKSLCFFEESEIELSQEDETFKQKKLTENGLIKEILSAPKPDLSDLVEVWNQAPKKEDTGGVHNENEDLDLSSDDFDLDEMDDEEIDEDEDVEAKLWQAIYMAIAGTYHEGIEILSYRHIDDGYTGIFIDIKNKCFFEYELNYKTNHISYRPHTFVTQLPTEKIELLERLSNSEISVILDLLLLINQFGGTLTLLTDEDFADEDAAIEKYGFYPAYEGACPVLLYETEGELLRLGTYFFWGDEDMDGLDDFFVDDIPDACCNNFDTLNEALQFMAKRLNYYVSEA